MRIEVEKTQLEYDDRIILYNSKSTVYTTKTIFPAHAGHRLESQTILTVLIQNAGCDENKLLLFFRERSWIIK